MDANDIAHTVKGERVTSVYADTYFNDNFCEFEDSGDENVENDELNKVDHNPIEEWKSPSDLLIGIIDLIPPFTSKITRGITHEGILGIGSALLQAERDKFQKKLDDFKCEQDAVWASIIEQQTQLVARSVKDDYDEILATKCKILQKEMDQFYESSLQELEDHLRRNLSEILNTAHANIVKDLNAEIEEKLLKERKFLTKVLNKRYKGEVKKIKHYYQLMLDNAIKLNNEEINKALYARNDAVRAFYKMIEAETVTSTMYVMCTERRKCRIKQFLLNNYHNSEVAEKLKILREREKSLDDLQFRARHISVVNKEWEEKIKKILRLFLKFVSFSLKLLPEQTTFLLELEKLVVLQLNEIQKTPTKQTILVDEREFNYFEFEEMKPKTPVCDKKPFVLVGDTDPSIPSSHSSRETLASNKDLPYMRVDRKFLYAKRECYNEIVNLIETERCKCHDGLPKPEPDQPPESTPSLSTQPSLPQVESSFEQLRMDDIKIIEDCPARCCKDWANKAELNILPDYLCFSEENYTRVKAAFGGQSVTPIGLPLIDPKDIVTKELPFGATREKYHNVEIQCNLEREEILHQETTPEKECTCPCVNPDTLDYIPRNKSIAFISSQHGKIHDIMKKRRDSLKKIISNNQNLLKIFTDEDFDFIYTIN